MFMCMKSHMHAHVYTCIQFTHIYTIYIHHTHTHTRTHSLTHTHTHTHSYSFNADIWGLGILAYECCAGRGPYQSKGTFELLDAIVDGDAPVYTLKRVYAYTRIRINAQTYARVYA